MGRRERSIRLPPNVRQFDVPSSHADEERDHEVTAEEVDTAHQMLAATTG